MGGATMLRGLLWKVQKRTKVSVGVEDLFDRRGAEAANQLVLEIVDTDEESQRLHAVAIKIGAETGPLETAPNVVLLAGVAQSRQPDVETERAEQGDELTD